MKHAELLIPAIALAARLIPGPRTIDDAFITFRYAQNLIQGEGLIYNPGEAVLGTTTPIYALLLAGLAMFFGGSQAPFQLLALIVNAVADAATCWMLPRLGERMGSRLAGAAAALIWAIAPWSVTFAIGGMETSLLVVLATATFYNHLSRQPVRAALIGSLALLTRPDALLFLLPLAAERISQVLKIPRARTEAPPGSSGELLAFCIPVGGWIIAGTALYGSPIPHSIFAKAAAYQLPPEAGVVRLIQHYGTPFLAHNVLGTSWLAIGVILYPALFLLGFRRATRETPSVWQVMIYPWVYFAAYAIANPLLFRWYLTPPLPAYWIGIFLGLERVSDDLKNRFPTVLMAAIALALGLNAWDARPDHGSNRPAPEMAFIKLELLYERAAERLDGVVDLIETAEVRPRGIDIGIKSQRQDLHRKLVREAKFRGCALDGVVELERSNHARALEIAAIDIARDAVVLSIADPPGRRDPGEARAQNRRRHEARGALGAGAE